jgi:hypothetical protein
MNHMNLSDELRKQLLESAEWGTLDINVDGDVEHLEEGGAKKGDKSKTDKGDEDYTTKKGMKKKTGKGFAFKASKDQDDEEGSEEVCEEVHVCPLCISQLDEAVDEERLLEHLDVVVGLIERLSNLNEGEEDVDEVINQALSDLLLGEEAE